MKAEEDSKRLVERAKEGDREAFEKLFKRHREHLEAVVRLRLGEPLRAKMEVEDVLQETLLRAWQALGRFSQGAPGSFFRWLSGIAARVILELAGKAKGHEVQRLDFEVQDQKRITPGKAMQREERFLRLRECLDALSPDYREVLLLVWIDGLSVQEIARKMNRSPNAVSHLLLRALRKLRSIFGDTESLGLPSLPGERDDDERKP